MAHEEEIETGGGRQVGGRVLPAGERGNYYGEGNIQSATCVWADAGRSSLQGPSSISSTLQRLTRATTV